MCVWCVCVLMCFCFRCWIKTCNKRCFIWATRHYYSTSVMKFPPPGLPMEPTQEQWSWWKRCFFYGWTINGIMEESHKLTFLRSCAGSILFTIIVGATTFTESIGILDAQFKKPSKIIYARHQVLSCKQQDDACITAFFHWLGILERCECKIPHCLSTQGHTSSRWSSGWS